MTRASLQSAAKAMTNPVVNEAMNCTIRDKLSPAKRRTFKASTESFVPSAPLQVIKRTHNTDINLNMFGKDRISKRSIENHTWNSRHCQTNQLLGAQCFEMTKYVYVL